MLLRVLYHKSSMTDKYYTGKYAYTGKYVCMPINLRLILDLFFFGGGAQITLEVLTSTLFQKKALLANRTTHTMTQVKKINGPLCTFSKSYYTLHISYTHNDTNKEN